MLMVGEGSTLKYAIVNGIVATTSTFSQFSTFLIKDKPIQICRPNNTKEKNIFCTQFFFVSFTGLVSESGLQITRRAE
jgi:hypothetical protein